MIGPTAVRIPSVMPPLKYWVSKFNPKRFVEVELSE